MNSLTVLEVKIQVNVWVGPHFFGGLCTPSCLPTVVFITGVTWHFPCVCVSMFKFLFHHNVEKESRLSHDVLALDIAGKLLYFRVFAIFLFQFQTTSIQKEHFPFRILRSVAVSPCTLSNEFCGKSGSDQWAGVSRSCLPCRIQHTSLLQLFTVLSQPNGYSVLFPFYRLYRGCLH